MGNLLSRTKEWWMARARREPDSAMGVGCLCLYAIEQHEGQPTIHDARCPVASTNREEDKG